MKTCVAPLHRSSVSLLHPLEDLARDSLMIVDDRLSSQRMLLVFLAKALRTILNGRHRRKEVINEHRVPFAVCDAICFASHFHVLE